MDDTYVYLIPLPQGINEMITPCSDGYTIYIDERLTWEERRKAYRHAVQHIRRMDFQMGGVQEIERTAHEGK